MADDGRLLRPRAQRPGIRTPSSTSDTSAPSTPADASTDGSLVSRTRSVLNLTSSTLFGIYAPSDYDPNRTEPSTPQGLGSQTPLPRQSVDEDRKPPIIGAFEKAAQQQAASIKQGRGYNLPSLITRFILLFGFGVAYGLVIIHLHDTQQVAPVKVQGIPPWSWTYMCGWGLVGVILGTLLPWIDTFWEENVRQQKDVSTSDKPSASEETQRPRVNGQNKRTLSSSAPKRSLGADWHPAVRSIGAFIGIAFAIRRLPWQSTSQVSLTLALVNPVLWYLVDRSKPGFLLSAIVGIAGTAIVFGLNPNIVPSPATSSIRAGNGTTANATPSMIVNENAAFSSDSIGVGVWVASVLFCSSVCFGNVGRRILSK